MAVNLGDYFARSMFRMKKGELAVVDSIPGLTETGGGTQMAFYEGISADSTERLSCTWCGDLLQIVDQPPDGYELIDCCFAEIWQRAKFCHFMFGTDASNYILGDWHGKRYECAVLDFRGTRGQTRYVRVELTKDKVKYITEFASNLKDAPVAEVGKDR
jgi:hypothetical protein